jgi:hypothetical protein
MKVVPGGRATRVAMVVEVAVGERRSREVVGGGRRRREGEWIKAKALSLVHTSIVNTSLLVTRLLS